MANTKKKLQQAAVKFRKESPETHAIYRSLLSEMARFITKSGATEVIIRMDPIDGNIYGKTIAEYQTAKA